MKKNTSKKNTVRQFPGTRLIAAVVLLSCLMTLCTFSACSKQTDEPAETPDPDVQVEESVQEEEELPRDTLIINEVMNYNEWYPAKDLLYYDFVEVKNISEEEINIQDYYLSDDPDDLMMYQMPYRKLQPGEIYIIYCTKEVFGISDTDTVYLTDKDGVLQDKIDTTGTRFSFSCGRVEGSFETCYFDKPTPKKENGEGYSEICEMPMSAEPDGVYEGVDSVTVTLSGKGDIRYTLDGSTPTIESELYKGPIKLTETTVVRAACFEKGKLYSETLDLSYIINEGHTLPVTSLVLNTDDFDGEFNGFYNHPEKDMLKECTLRFFDDDGEGFKIRCGVKLHGATSKYKQPKKSMGFKFKNRFEGQLEYDLFDNGVTEFESVILRSAQELQESTQIKDILFQELAQQCCPELCTQDYKFTILYINGEYWGVYAFREQHSEKHYAEHSGYKKSDIAVEDGDWVYTTDFDQYYAFAITQTMKEQENYDYVAEHVDIDALIAWAIIEGYSANLDIQPHNVKFYYTFSDSKLHIALLDLDLAGDSLQHLPLSTGYKYSILLGHLLANDGFRDLFLRRAAEYLEGPLSDENVFSLRDSLAAEIRDEIPRDAERWHYKVSFWEEDVGETLSENMGRGTVARHFVETIKYALHLSGPTVDKYFSNVK